MNSSPAVAPMFSDMDDLLEAFENAWDTGMPPDMCQFVSQCPEEEVADAVSELIQIDMERRWRSSSVNEPLGLRDYLKQLPKPAAATLDTQVLRELVCSEYRIRNQWGDCVIIDRLFQKHRRLGNELLQQLKEAAMQLQFPEISVTVDNQKRVEAVLDRPINFGRQRSREPGSWTVLSSDDQHRIVLCETSDPTISRDQLTVSLKAPGRILARNRSVGRALAVRYHKSLQPGEACEYGLPAMFHLGGKRFLTIAPPKKR